MKKSLIAILLTVALISPVFAQKGEMSINAKAGAGLNNNISFNASNNADTFGFYDVNVPFILGAEFFYGIVDNLSLGLGASYVFDTSTKKKSEIKCGTTNIYLAVKPEAKIDSDIFSSIYLTGQIGLSMGRVDFNGESPSVHSGIYLGLGLGTTIKDAFFVELLFSSCNGSISEKNSDFQYSITSLNVGYKFSL